MNRCKRCVMPDTRPDTPFTDGVCQACLNYDKQQLNSWDIRKQVLVDLLNSQHDTRELTGFDCIVASSGGKDSTAQVIALLDLGFKPLLVTATTCMLTPIGRENIDNLKRLAPTIEVTLDQTVRAKLNRLGLEMLGDISWPEHVAIFTTPLKMAIALGIPLVFYGENPQAAYGGPVGTEDSVLMTRRWVSEFGGFLGLRPADVVGLNGISEEDMLPYQFPTDEEIDIAGCEVHFLGQYLGPWDSHKNAQIAAKAGMKQIKPSQFNWWVHENLDNAMTGIHDYLMFKKYGYSRACSQLSVDVRRGVLTREKALWKLDYIEGRVCTPVRYAGIPLGEVLGRIGMTRTQLDEITEQFTNHELS